jgi:hypothetical protein
MALVTDFVLWLSLNSWIDSWLYKGLSLNPLPAVKAFGSSKNGIMVVMLSRWLRISKSSENNS